MKRTALASSALALSTACFPVIEDAPWLVGAPRIIAARSEPAEAGPGEAVRLEALVATPDGMSTTAVIQWAWCLNAPTVADPRRISESCHFAAEGSVMPLDGPDALVPLDACSRFGPIAPPSDPSSPPLRPLDPDTTGGYHQPARAEAREADEIAFGAVRLRCPLASAPLQIAMAYAARYAPNAHPRIAAVERGDGSPLEDGARVGAGAELDLRVRWSDDDAELYPYFDLDRRALVDRREAIAVTWSTTAGAFATFKSGRSEDEAVSGATPEASNVWRAPATPGPVTLFLVLRDSRGGSSWRAVDLIVE